MATASKPSDVFDYGDEEGLGTGPPVSNTPWVNPGPQPNLSVPSSFNPYAVGQLDAMMGLGGQVQQLLQQGQQAAGYPTQGSGSVQFNFGGNSGGTAYPYDGGNPSQVMSPVMNPMGQSPGAAMSGGGMSAGDPNSYQPNPDNPNSPIVNGPTDFGNSGNSPSLVTGPPSVFPYDAGAYSPAPPQYNQYDQSGGWTGVTSYDPNYAVQGLSQGGNLFA